MIIYTRGEPTANNEFRASTAKNAGSMVLVNKIPKLCRCIRCEKLRTARTGKHTSAGFICGMCK